MIVTAPNDRPDDSVRARCTMEVMVKTRTALAPEKVRFVVGKRLIRVPAPVKVQVPLPMLKVRTPLPPTLNAVPDASPSVTLLLLVAKVSVPVNAPIVNDEIVTVPPKLTVTVPPPDDPSKVTSSAEPGTLAPPAPPVAVDQCVVVELSHVPVPPTQKRAAIGWLP